MKGFPFPMKKHEAVFGWMYLFIHAALLLPALQWLAEHIFTSSDVTETGLNVIYYAIGVILIFAVMFAYMRESFRDLCGNWRGTASAILLGYLIYYVVTALVTWLLGVTVKEGGSAAVISVGGKLNSDPTILVGVILAPIVEEVLFRGTVFGTLRKKNRALAYAVSAFLFAFYHLWRYFFYSYHWTLFLYMVQFIPAGLVLDWCYEKSRSVWGPILLHMLINLVTITITFGY